MKRTTNAAVFLSLVLCGHAVAPAQPAERARQTGEARENQARDEEARQAEARAAAAREEAARQDDAQPEAAAARDAAADRARETVYAEASLYVASPPPPDRVLEGMIRESAAENAGVLRVAPTNAAGLVAPALPAPRQGWFGGDGGRGGGGGGGRNGGRGAAGGEASQDDLNLRVDLRPLAGKAGLQPRAGDFLDNVVVSLEERLREWHRQQQGVPQADRAVKQAEEALEAQRGRLRNTEAEIRHLTGRADASVEAIREALPKLDEERQSLKLQGVGKQARQAALAETIERLAKAAGERAKDDAVAGELEKVVAAREHAVAMARQLHEQASVSAQEVSHAEAALAEARAKMLERREAVAQANGGELLDALNRELAMLSIDVAESEAKLAAVDALLEKYVIVQAPLTQADDVRRARQKAEALLESAEARRANALAAVPEPLVRVLKLEALGADDPRLKQIPVEGDAPHAPGAGHDRDAAPIPPGAGDAGREDSQPAQ